MNGISLPSEGLFSHARRFRLGKSKAVFWDKRNFEETFLKTPKGSRSIAKSSWMKLRDG